MTIDDDSSIYVGGLSYDVSEESLRRVFDIYGAVIAVKLINDRATGAKCYGFVTFANPRSAAQAIREMDGKTIDGRVVKVNEVRSRGRPNFNRESSRRDFDMGIEDDGRKGQRRDFSYDRQHDRDLHRERFRDYERESERGHHRIKERYVDEDQFERDNGPKGDVEQGRVRKHERNWEKESSFNSVDPRNNSRQKSVDKDGRVRKHERDWERDSSFNIVEPRNNSRQKSVDMDNPPLNRSTVSDDRSREPSVESLNDDQDQIEIKLAASDHKIEELREEISRMKGYAADKEEQVSQLREKYQKLDDSLKAAKKLTSHRQMQLEKLHKCYLQVRDYDKKFKNAEKELQLFVDSTRMELEMEGV